MLSLIDSSSESKPVVNSLEVDISRPRDKPLVSSGENCSMCGSLCLANLDPGVSLGVYFTLW